MLLGALFRLFTWAKCALAKDWLFQALLGILKSGKL